MDVLSPNHGFNLKKSSPCDDLQLNNREHDQIINFRKQQWLMTEPWPSSNMNQFNQLPSSEPYLQKIRSDLPISYAMDFQDMKQGL